MNESLKAENKEEFWPEFLKNLLVEKNLEVIPVFKIEIPFEDQTFQEILRHFLPENIEIPTGFEQIGHIAHFNLQKEVFCKGFNSSATALCGNNRLSTIREAKKHQNSSKQVRKTTQCLQNTTAKFDGWKARLRNLDKGGFLNIFPKL